MKILKIEFQNINSLEGKHSIDFTQEPFIQNNLFAITGPTGSGKSTILDVIPLALFNKIPRLDGTISKSVMVKQGAILTRGQKEAYARVQYACKEGIFTSEWTVRVARTGALQDYEMFLYDASGKPITQKKSEVPSKNEELIGLNYEQFIKSVMLAQGEFNKFLKVKREERSALLEQITGTDIYRKIGIAAFEKYKTYKSSVEDWQKTIADIQAKLPTEEETKLWAEEEKEFTKQKNGFQVDLEAIKTKLKQWADFAELKSKLDKIDQDLDQKQKIMLAFDANQGKQLIQHEKTDGFAEELSEFQHLNQSKTDLTKQLKTKTEAFENAKDFKSKAKTNILNWLKVEDIAEENISNALETFRKEMVSLKEKQKEKRVACKEILSDIKHLLEPIDLQYKVGEEAALENRLNTVSSWLKSENVKELSKADYLKEKEALEEKETEIQKAELLASDIQYLTQSIQEKTDKKFEVSTELEKLPKQIENLQVQFDKGALSLENLELKIKNQNLEKSLEDYRNQLKNDEPCPLCGSLDHPYATHIPQKEDDLEKQRNTLKKEVDQYKTNLIQLKTKRDSFAKTIQDLEKELKSLNDKLEPLNKNFSENFKAFNIKDDFKIKREEIKKAEKRLEKINTSVQEKTQLAKALPLTKSLNELIKEGTEIGSKIKDSIGEKTDPNTETQNLLTSWNSTKQALEQNEKALKEINEQSETMERKLKVVTSKLLPIIAQNGFADIQNALASRLSAEKVLLLRKQRQEMANEINELKGTQKVYVENRKRLTELLKDSNQQELQERDAELKKKLNEIEERLKQLFAQKSQHQTYLKDIKTLKEKIASENQQSRIWRMLDSMIGDARGKKFNDFAQDLTLNHLLHLANRRLDQLKSRYLLSQPTQEEDDGLVAIDKDMGNQRRSVRTLSGGESFILSLALALALSDLASKNVKIDTLFIDEGFGTLDPETLDKTLDTLERLQQENQKTIGVISHVEALKERIATQIQLSQNGYGLSELKVVG